MLVNPPASKLGSENAILNAKGRQHHVRDFAGPLSIKTVVHGTALWEIGNRRFDLDASSFLIVNDAEPYSITVNSPDPVETLCVFFQHGFVEDAWRAKTASQEAL